MRRLLIGFLGLFCFSTHALAADNKCHPAVDAKRPQFIIGYGSLMETESKKRSSPTSGLNHPVFVKGFERAWNTKGNAIGFSTTYLGILNRSDTASQSGDEPYIAAVVYEDPDRSDIAGTDQRETFYCRVAVDPERIDILDGWKLPDDAQVWIYALDPNDAFGPTPDWPIVQSYVDIFLTGCMQLQKQLLPERAKTIHFPSECIRTTSEWSVHWKNDRLYPRRAFIYQPNALAIDTLLQKMLPKEFGSIKIE